MKITSLTLEHSNASMGPHETIITIDLMAAEQHKARINQFLDEAIDQKWETLPPLGSEELLGAKDDEIVKPPQKP